MPIIVTSSNCVLSKELFVKISLYSQENICVEVSFKMFSTFFLDSRFQNHPDSVILQKYQSLSNQSFKQNSAYMSFLNLTHTLSFEPRFRMFIINGYDKKSKRL